MRVGIPFIPIQQHIHMQFLRFHTKFRYNLTNNLADRFHIPSQYPKNIIRVVVIVEGVFFITS